jgi:hypothetical protein
MKGRWHCFTHFSQVLHGQIGIEDSLLLCLDTNDSAASCECISNAETSNLRAAQMPGHQS